MSRKKETHNECLEQSPQDFRVPCETCYPGDRMESTRNRFLWKVRLQGLECFPFIDASIRPKYAIP